MLQAQSEAEKESDCSGTAGAANALAQAAESTAGNAMLPELFAELRSRQMGYPEGRSFLRLMGRVGSRNTAARMVSSALEQSAEFTWFVMPSMFDVYANMVKSIAKNVEPNELARVLQAQDSSPRSRALATRVIAAVPQCGQTEEGGRMIISLLDSNVVELRLEALEIARRSGWAAPGVENAIHRRLLDEDRTVRDGAWEVLFPLLQTSAD
jgi:hypothetical protein